MHDENRHDRQRIARLRTLAAELELLPRTRARDHLLREVHHRAVMLDTGVPAPSCWGDEPANGQVALFQDMALLAVTRIR
jgi:hypothetical protein